MRVTGEHLANHGKTGTFEQGMYGGWYEVRIDDNPRHYFYLRENLEKVDKFKPGDRVRYTYPNRIPSPTWLGTITQNVGVQSDGYTHYHINWDDLEGIGGGSEQWLEPVEKYNPGDKVKVKVQGPWWVQGVVIQRRQHYPQYQVQKQSDKSFAWYGEHQIERLDKDQPLYDPRPQTKTDPLVNKDQLDEAYQNGWDDAIDTITRRIPKWLEGVRESKRFAD